MQKITIPKVKNLITKRPEGMDFELYRKLRKEQKEMLYWYWVTDRVGIDWKVICRFIPGRLGGVRIPAEHYRGHCSKDFPIVIK